MVGIVSGQENFGYGAVLAPGQVAQFMVAKSHHHRVFVIAVIGFGNQVEGIANLRSFQTSNTS
jgi:hypothetical protein